MPWDVAIQYTVQSLIEPVIPFLMVTVIGTSVAAKLGATAEHANFLTKHGEVLASVPFLLASALLLTGRQKTQPPRSLSPEIISMTYTSHFIPTPSTFTYD